MAVTEYTASISGSGKSYRRCAHFLATEFLPLQTGRIWSNFPIHIDEMVADVVEHHPDLVPLNIKERIKIIPEEVLKSWRMEKSGPWDYFSQEDLSGDRIAIDEIHNYVPKSASKDYVQKWTEFLGELRHRGCEFEALTQNDPKVHASIRNEAGLKREMFNCENTRDPFLGILMADWYNIRAKFFTGEYTAAVFEYEYIMFQRKWQCQHTLRFVFESRFYKLYDSYSKPVAGGKKATGPIQPWKEKTKWGLIGWFLWRNGFNISWRFGVLSFIIWFCFFGGGLLLLNSFAGLQKEIMDSNAKQKRASTADKGQQIGSPANGNSETISNPSGSEPINQRIQQLEKTILEQTAEIDRYKKLLDTANDITLLGKDYAITRSGFHLVPGDAIPSGLHQGKVVKAIDYRHRHVVLADGTVLRLLK